jgi:hypothetical protein
MSILRCACVAALFAMSVPALAADWKVAGLGMGSGNRSVTYVDAASIHIKRGKVRFQSEQYLESLAAGYDRISTLSEVDCESMTLTVLRESLHSGRSLVAFGDVPRISNHYSSSTSQHWVLRRVCEGNYLSEPVEDHDRDSARMFTLDWSPVPGRLSVAMPVVTGRPSTAQVASVMGAGAPRR